MAVLVTVVKGGKWDFICFCRLTEEYLLSMLFFNDLDLKVQTARASLRVLVIMYYDTTSDRFKLVFLGPVYAIRILLKLAEPENIPP